MAIAEPVVGFLIQKLTELLAQEASLLVGIEEQVRSLERELQRIRCFLRDADGKCNENERVKNWVKDVREVAYDAEDAIDTFVLKIQRQHRGGFMGFLKRCASINKEMKVRHRLSNQMEAINKRIVEIKESRSTYGIDSLQEGEGTSDAQWKRSRDPRRASYPEEEAEVVGIGEAADTLEGRLVGGDSRLTIVSIVGMGGLGKTTLAKIVYNRDNVRRYFGSCHAWVSVSQEYSVGELLKVLVKQLMGLPQFEMEKMKMEELKVKLSGYLKGRRYLIVLDDIWKIEAWDALKSAFPDRKNGSRIILTTRNEDVALHAQSWSPPHKLRFLNDDESWELFLKKAFPENEEASCPSDLESLGRTIVKKCGGLPLAIIVVGGLLSAKGNAPHLWEKVLRSLNWALSEGPHQIKTILALSYHDLQYDLKSCFLYCGIFPEDYEFDAGRLILLWVAEGFIQERGEETMEEVAEEHLEELISRSMIQVSDRYESGKAKTCRLHDLLRDFSISEAKAGNFFDIYSNQNSLNPSARVRRLAICDDDNIVNYVTQKQPTPHLRSFVGITNQHRFIRNRGVNNLFGGFQLLRVLDLQDVNISILPDKIGDLIHLRFLGLGSRELSSLPSSIANLRSLQTLDISRTFVTRLPTEIWEMKYLRHLYLTFGGISMPKILGMNHLRNLQTLMHVNAGSWIKDELQSFTNLRNLQIKLMSSNHYTGLCESIVKLNHLNQLGLHGETCPTLVLSHLQHIYELNLGGTLEKLPELHEFPSNLVKLELSSSRLQEDPFTTLDGLPKLRSLVLDEAYIGKEMRCSAGGFPQLEQLNIERLEELEEVSVEGGGMPSLRHLTISHCPSMKKPPIGLDHMILSCQGQGCVYTPPPFQAQRL